MKFHSFLLVALVTSFSLLLNSTSTAEENVENQTKNRLTEVILLPTIHQNHLRSKTYGLPRLEEAIRAIKPDIICTEITEGSLENYKAGKKDRRLSFFPEYIKVILPLQKELGYTVVPSSAYSKEVNFKTVGVKKMTRAHFENIAKTLDQYKGQGKRILVTFGSGHIEGLKKHLQDRNDIKIIDYRDTLNASAKK